MSVEGLVSMYSDLVASEQRGPLRDSVPVDPGLRLPVSQLQAGNVHLHPVIKGEDGGGAGARGPLFHVADGLIEVFPTRQASSGQCGGS